MKLWKLATPLHLYRNLSCTVANNIDLGMMPLKWTLDHTVTIRPKIVDPQPDSNVVTWTIADQNLEVPGEETAIPDTLNLSQDLPKSSLANANATRYTDRNRTLTLPLSCRVV